MANRIMHRGNDHLLAMESILRAYSRRADGKFSGQKLWHLMASYRDGFSAAIHADESGSHPVMAGPNDSHNGGARINMYYYGYKHGVEMVKTAKSKTSAAPVNKSEPEYIARLALEGLNLRYFRLRDGTPSEKEMAKLKEDRERVRAFIARSANE